MLKIYILDFFYCIQGKALGKSLKMVVLSAGLTVKTEKKKTNDWAITYLQLSKKDSRQLTGNCPKEHDENKGKTIRS